MYSFWIKIFLSYQSDVDISNKRENRDIGSLKRRDSYFLIKIRISCWVHTTSNFIDSNRLFFKLQPIDHRYKILVK